VSGSISIFFNGFFWINIPSGTDTGSALQLIIGKLSKIQRGLEKIFEIKQKYPNKMSAVTLKE